MKQLFQKLSCHGKKTVHFGITLPVVALVIVSLVDIPLFTMAQELKMETPIVHIYKTMKVTQATKEAPKPAVEKATPVSTAPAVETTTAQPATAVEPTPAAEPQKVEQPAQPASPEAGTAVSPEPAKQQVEVIEEKEEIEFVDTREVQNALQDIKRMLNDLKRFIKQLKKVKNSADDIAAMNELSKQLTEHQKLIKNPPADMSLREVLQDYWDGRYWEEVDVFRAKAEIPNELKNIDKDLKRLKKLVTQKQFKNLGFDMALISGAIAEIEAAYNETKTAYDAGNMEDALTALDGIRGGMHPGEITGIFYQTREIKDKISFIKNKEVKELINELLSTVIESVNNGEYRGANQTLNEIRQELFKIMSKFMKKAGILDDKTREKLEALEQIIENKLNKEEPAKEKAE